jgi:hypothetical protein
MGRGASTPPPGYASPSGSAYTSVKVHFRYSASFSRRQRVEMCAYIVVVVNDGVPERLLNVLEIGAIFGEARGEAVAERVRVHRPADDRPHHLPDDPEHAARHQ